MRLQMLICSIARINTTLMTYMENLRAFEHMSSVSIYEAQLLLGLIIGVLEAVQAVRRGRILRG